MQQEQIVSETSIDIDAKIKRVKYDAIWWIGLVLVINSIMIVAITYAVLLSKANSDSLIDQWNMIIKLNKRVIAVEQSIQK